MELTPHQASGYAIMTSQPYFQKSQVNFL